MVHVSESYWVGHNKLLDFHWGIFNPFLKEAIAIKKPYPMRIFSARQVGFFSSETLRGFELEKYYRRSAILTPTPGTRTHTEKKYL